ncbi:hypothetical protein SBOR_6431 [Sclerotinia borealis F-4128]|uniref:Uncharacterized protein n=1 Tax=Sclerotinia borealis (strain F-4128) TaxID=1432307 RepID=W9CEH7_SCLBF|nr:hypothetical protein SBOR_6431 [Sclerotinia borealis F-4128]
MGSSKVSQKHNHSSTYNSPKVHTPRRTYHVPSDPPFVYHDNECTDSRTVSTRASLPSMQSDMYTQESSNFSSMRPASAHSSRRSVSGMKRLLPLKLSSPQIPDSDSWSRSTSTSSKRTTFGQSGRLGDLSNSGSIKESRVAFVPRLAIRPERYRDTPIISKPGSPLIGSLLYQDGSCIKCSDEVTCTTSCIINEYDGFSDSSSSKECSSDYSNRHTQSAASTPISSRRRYGAGSDFSFKCLGEPIHKLGSSWFGSHVKERVIPRLSTMNIEEWLSDSASSMCESSDDEDSDDFFACATALAPARAHVVQVNNKQSPRLSITIPGRSSSATRSKHSDFSALRKLTSRSPIKTSLIGDLAMSSPPASPEEPASNKFPNNNQQKAAGSPVDPSPTPASPDTILDIVAAIDECTSNFPTKMLLADTPCISSIRSHLKATSTTSASKSSSHHLIPPPPPPPTTNFNQTRPKGLNRRNRPQKICLSPTTKTRSLTSQIPTTPPSTPPFSPDFSLSSFPSSTNPPTTFKPSNQPSILPTFAYQLAAANLQPLHTIFPISSDFLRSALYAHILAYIFLQSLPSTHGNPHAAHLPSHAHINHHAASHSLRKQRSVPQSFSSYHSTSIVGIPAKAASTLGLSSSTSTRRYPGAPTQNKRIELNLRSCIGKLLKGMEGRVDAQVGKAEVEGWVLRSLIEVVRGCEGF